MIRTITQQHIIWPPIDSELEDLRHLLRGVVLNVGCGERKVSHLIDGTLTNQDLAWPNDTRTNLDIVSPLHNIPRPDSTFDSVICIAVLEHVINPIECVAEIFRVTKPGGHVIASVPFLQPEHKSPEDYQRYTRDGLETLFKNAGFEIVESRPLFSVYHTLHWLAFEWLVMRNTLLYKALRLMILPTLAVLAKRSTLVSDKVAAGFRVVARKP